jgi:DNA modification methylase
VAKWLNRHYVGYEIIPKYIELAKRRLEEPLMLRPEQLVARFEKVGLEKLSP